MSELEKETSTVSILFCQPLLLTLPHCTRPIFHKTHWKPLIWWSLLIPSHHQMPQQSTLDVYFPIATPEQIVQAMSRGLLSSITATKWSRLSQQSLLHFILKNWLRNNAKVVHNNLGSTVHASKQQLSHPGNRYVSLSSLFITTEHAASQGLASHPSQCQHYLSTQSISWIYHLNVQQRGRSHLELHPHVNRHLQSTGLALTSGPT